MSGASASAHSRAMIRYPRCIGKWSVHPSRLSDSGVADDQSMSSHDSASSSSNEPLSLSEDEEGSLGLSPETSPTSSETFTPFVFEAVMPEKAPDNDRPTEASLPDAVTGSFDSRMFCTTFVKFVVPRNETVCRRFSWSVAMNTRCFTDTMSITTTSSPVTEKNASISDVGAPFSDAIFANRRSSSNVDTTGNGGCVAARVFACRRFVVSRRFFVAVATTSASPSRASVRTFEVFELSPARV
mmetsp:Transcript_11744/g.49237  ORF Transcript_11744/g.49237 Transcript_11744/m.49237 type:complete len:242 (-) Transcript_11744:249-974(-)